MYICRFTVTALLVEEISMKGRLNLSQPEFSSREVVLVCECNVLEMKTMI
jgi:hypothetical protein